MVHFMSTNNAIYLIIYYIIYIISAIGTLPISMDVCVSMHGGTSGLPMEGRNNEFRNTYSESWNKGYTLTLQEAVAYARTLE